MIKEKAENAEKDLFRNKNMKKDKMKFLEKKKKYF